MYVCVCVSEVEGGMGDGGNTEPLGENKLINKFVSRNPSFVIHTLSLSLSLALSRSLSLSRTKQTDQPVPVLSDLD